MGPIWKWKAVSSKHKMTFLEKNYRSRGPSTREKLPNWRRISHSRTNCSTSANSKSAPSETPTSNSSPNSSKSTPTSREESTAAIWSSAVTSPSKSRKEEEPVGKILPGGTRQEGKEDWFLWVWWEEAPVGRGLREGRWPTDWWGGGGELDG